MAGDMYKKVQAGDRMRIPAAAYNAFIDVARDRQRVRPAHAYPAGANAAHPGLALVRNDSGEPCGQFAVLGIEGPLITPVENLIEFSSRVALRGVLPATEHAGRFAILGEALDGGAIGRAVVAGVGIARVQMEDEAHAFAECLASVTDRLQSRASGSARLLWVEPVVDRSAPDLAWAVVRLGNGAPALGSMFPVSVTIDGGSAGSATATCSFTYQVATLDGVVLGSGLAPKRRRFPETPYTLTPAGTIGAAYFNQDGVLHLWDANELPDSEEEC